jgi:MFS family permease
MTLAKSISNKTPFYYGWIILGASGTTLIVRNAAASLTLAVFMYPMAQELEWSRTVIAGASSAGGIAAIFASPFVGWAIDKYGARAVLTISIVTLGLSTFISGWATLPIMFYLSYGYGRIIFSSPIQIGASVVVSRWFIKQRGRANGILSFCHSIGMTAFPLLASILINAYSWQMAWHIFGILVLVLGLPTVYLLIKEAPEDILIRPDGVQIEPTNSNSHIEHNWSLKKAVKTIALWQLALSGGLFYVVHGGINTHMSAFMQDAGLSANQAAIAISINAISTGIGGLAWGWASENISTRNCYSILSIMMSLSAVLFNLTDNIFEAWFISALFGISLGGMLVVPSVAIANYYGRKSLGTIKGFTEPFGSAGTAFGALLSGLIYDTTGSYEYAFLIMGLSSILALIITARISLPKPKSM